MVVSSRRIKSDEKDGTVTGFPASFQRVSEFPATRKPRFMRLIFHLGYALSRFCWLEMQIIMQNVWNTTDLRSRVERDQLGRSVLARVPSI